MSKIRIILTVALLFSFFSLSISTGFAKKNKDVPPIYWSQEKVEINAEGGESYSINVQFESYQALSDVSLWVVPELQPYISVTPAEFAAIEPNTPYSVSINLSIPAFPVVTITSPETLTTVGSSPIEVTGTVDDPDDIVTVNGVSATVNPKITSYDGTIHLRYGSETIPEILKVELTIENGTYSVSGITLTEGSNTITAMAIDEDDNVGTAHATIYFDSTPPLITINLPEDGYVATSSPITVTGIIYDIVKGTVNENNATVDVNGISASVSNKTFMVEDLPLVEGENIITATAADQTGNTASTSISIMLDLSVNKKINMLSGNNQTGTINTQLPGPLVISLTNADGSPASGETVIFKVTQNNGLLTGNGTAPSLAEVTDANGVAFVLHTLGSTSGVGNNKVEAMAVGFTGQVVFTASATEMPPHKINIGSGNNQRGAVITPLPNPLVAVVTDEGHNVIKGVPVTFTVTGGGGNIGGSTTTVVNTDSDGRATISFTLGLEEGLDNNIVTANFAGNTTAAAIFRASGLAVGDPGDTSISGVVLDNSNIPIPGVTLRVEGTTREGVTDDEGQFMILSVPVGPLHLIVDGSTATFSGEFPVLSFEIVTVAGQNNTLGMPIYLLPLNTENTQWVGGDEDVVYELENIPGFSLNIKANSVTFPDGSNEGFISVTQVHADKVPMEPPNGLQPRFIITIQPPGAVFDPPAPITIPNVDGLAPGEITEMYSFDHDLGQFVSIGTGTVSEDGMVIASDPGVGIIKAGWHCGGDPVQAGTGEILAMQSISPSTDQCLCEGAEKCFTASANAPGIKWDVTGGNYTKVSETPSGNFSTICLKFNEAKEYTVKAICEKGSPVSKSVKVTAIDVDVIPSTMNTIESLDSEEFEVTIKPSGLSVSSYKWLTTDAWPATAGNSPALDYSAPTVSKSRVNNTRWFAPTPSRKQVIDGTTSTYKINAEVTINGIKCDDTTPASLNVSVDMAGQTIRPNFQNWDSIIVEEIGGVWRVTGQGSFSRSAPVPSVNMPNTSQFYDKAMVHENKHVTQWTSEAPWKDLFEADALYTSTISTLTSTIDEVDLRSKIWNDVLAKFNSDNTIANNTVCDREKGAFDAMNAVDPDFLELDDSDWKPLYGCP